jgi:hypothetical protein
METPWIIAVALFLVVTFILWKLTIGPFKKEYGEKRRKIWGQRTFYWQDVLYISSGITFLLLVLLKWTNVLTFEV